MAYASVMNGYHELDGVPCAADRNLLTGPARTWGFDGTVVSDYFAVRQLDSYHHFAQDASEAATVAPRRGLDVELPATDATARRSRRALDAGEVSEAELDDGGAAGASAQVRARALREPVRRRGRGRDGRRTPSGTATWRGSIARRSLVLLKNDGVLPLLAGSRTVALIGPNADDARHLLGDYSLPGPHRVVGRGAQATAVCSARCCRSPDDRRSTRATEVCPTVRDELAARLGDRLRFAPGCDVLDPSTDGFAEAVAAAAAADVAVLVLGDRSGLTPGATTGESRDRSSLDLPGVQEELVRAVVATGTPVVAVLVAGRPVGSDFLHEDAQRC